jgi:hypothetical protein
MVGIFNYPNNINLIHRGRAKVSASVKCLVLTVTKQKMNVERSLLDDIKTKQL